MKKLAVIFAAIIAAFSYAPAYAQNTVGQPTAGYDYSGNRWHPFNTDSQGRLNVIGSAAGGSVYGPDAAGGAQSHAPLVLAGVATGYGATGGTIYQIHVDSSGNVYTVPTGNLTTGTSGIAGNGFMVGGSDGTNYRHFKTDTSGDLNVIFPTAQSVNAGQTGTWTVQPGNTANTTPWLFQGNVTAADGSALMSTLKTFDLNGYYNGSTVDMARAINSASTSGAGVASVAVQPVSAAGAAIVPVVSTTAESGHVLKASAGNLYRLRVTTTVAGYVLITNTTTTAGNGAVTPQSCTSVGVGTSEIDHANLPDRFSTGISVVFSTTDCFTNTLSATAMFEGSVQ